MFWRAWIPHTFIHIQADLGDIGGSVPDHDNKTSYNLLAGEGFCLQFVKITTSVEHNKMKYNTTRCACTSKEHIPDGRQQDIWEAESGLILIFFTVHICMFKTFQREHAWLSHQKNLNRNEISQLSDTKSFLPAVQGLVTLNWSPGLNNQGWISLSTSQHHCSRSWLFGVASRNQHHRTQVNNVWPGCPREGAWVCLHLNSCH